MKNKSFFWTSYSDLMTSLFFVMLLLFVTTVIMMYAHGKANEEELNKIHQLEHSVQAIDSRYFEYNSQFKKHVLKIDVQFPIYDSNIESIDPAAKHKLLAAGSRIVQFIDSIYAVYESPFLVVVEGQSSKGPYWRNVHENNDVLSYERALALVNFWEAHDVSLRDANHAQKCELLVCGSGDKGVMRMMPDVPTNAKNQRFLVHVIPKPGMIEHKTSDNYSSTNLSTNNTDIP